MGYGTYIDGEIQLKDEKAIKILNYLISEELPPFSEYDGIIFSDDEKNIIDINGEWKNYEEEIEKICYFIKSLDKDAEGIISCEGEDSFDLWKIELNKRGVEILLGKVSYEFERNYKDEDTEEKARAVLNDDQLNKKIILSKLTNKNEQQ